MACKAICLNVICTAQRTEHFEERAVARGMVIREVDDGRVDEDGDDRKSEVGRGGNEVAGDAQHGPLGNSPQ